MKPEFSADLCSCPAREQIFFLVGTVCHVDQTHEENISRFGFRLIFILVGSNFFAEQISVDEGISRNEVRNVG